MVQLMTCQICGRAIKASKGLIAHHGYTRPNCGWQTDSCSGARYEPYEVSCERLRHVIEGIKVFIARQEKEFSEFLETPPQTLTVVEKRGSSYGPEKLVTYEKPEYFNKESNGKTGSAKSHTYENAYKSKFYSYQGMIKSVKGDLLYMETRLADWKAIVAAE